MRRKYRMVGLLVLSLFLITGCGGGSTGGSAGTSVTQPTSAVLKFSTQGSIATEAQGIEGITMTVNTPPGVLVDSTNNALDIKPSGVTAGKATVTVFEHTAASSTAGGKLTVVLVSSEQAGFGTGEFATLNCSVSAGAFPKATDFTLSNTAITPSSIEGLSITLAADIK